MKNIFTYLFFVKESSGEWRMPTAFTYERKYLRVCYFGILILFSPHVAVGGQNSHRLHRRTWKIFLFFSRKSLSQTSRILFSFCAYRRPSYLLCTLSSFQIFVYIFKCILKRVNNFFLSAPTRWNSIVLVNKIFKFARWYRVFLMQRGLSSVGTG